MGRAKRGWRGRGTARTRSSRHSDVASQGRTDRSESSRGIHPRLRWMMTSRMMITSRGSLSVGRGQGPRRSRQSKGGLQPTTLHLTTATNHSPSNTHLRFHLRPGFASNLHHRSTGGPTRPMSGLRIVSGVWLSAQPRLDPQLLTSALPQSRIQHQPLPLTLHHCQSSPNLRSGDHPR